MGVNLNNIFEIHLHEQYEKPVLDKKIWKLPPFQVEYKGQFIKIVGTLSDISDHGLIANLEGNKTDLTKALGEFILLICLIDRDQLPIQKKLLCAKSKKVKNVYFENPLLEFERILDYYFHSMQNASPLISEWTHDLVHQEPETLKNSLELSLNNNFHPLHNAYIHWLCQNEAPNTANLVEHWQHKARELFSLSTKHGWPKMNSFNVLNRDVNVHKSYLLEASAGTGKTFSIENIVVRLLIEDEASKTLDKILVVTFTRAATGDLKIRIRAALENSLDVLNGVEKTAPDYLLAILEMGPEKIGLAKRRLEQALAIFDQAQIYTIHSFCLRMLTTFVFESDFHMHAGTEEKNLTKEEMLQLVRDFFRTKMHPEIYSPAQLQVVLDENDKSIEKVQKELLKVIEKDCIISPYPSFSSDLNEFNAIMHRLKTEYGFTAEKMQEDFEKQVDCYKALKNNKNSTIPPFIALFNKNEWSVDDFDLLIKDGLTICELIKPSNAKQNKKCLEKSTLHYPDLFSVLQEALSTLAARAGSYEFIFARMAYDCSQLVKKYLTEEEKHHENDLLKMMLKALDNPAFAARVRGLYQAVIIDEFQDTDPAQWEIFQKLFLNTSCLLYIVGDPKQSIYAFRQADIYTYLSAAQALGPEHHASLDTNYRSQPSLIKGLNTLFQACPKVFALPALEPGQSLDYSSVKAAPHARDKSFSDHLGSIHFFYAADAYKDGKKFPSETCEKAFYYPFIAQEIIRLHSFDKLKFNQFAVLIKDRYQAQRLADFLALYDIPYALQKQAALTECMAWDSLKELLQAVLQPKNENFVKIALGGQILQWNHQEVKTLDDPTSLERILAEFHSLKRKLNDGFALFFSYLDAILLGMLMGTQ